MNLYTRSLGDALKGIRFLTSSLGTNSKSPGGGSRTISLSDLPSKPKRPAGPWNRFVTEYKDVMKGARLSESMRIIGAKWKNMSAGERAPYEAAFSQENAVYKEQIKEYNRVMKQKIPMDKMLKILESEREAAVKAGRKEKRTKPKSGWNLFTKESLLTNHGPFLSNGKPDLSAIGKSWNSLSESERQSYNERARQAN